MLKKSRLFAIIFVVIFLTSAFFGCKAKDNTVATQETKAQEQTKEKETNNAEATQETAEPVRLVMWNSFFAGPEDTKIDKNDWYITQAIERFQEVYPNVEIEVSTVDSSTDTLTKFKVASLAKNGPDIVTLWSCSYSLSVKDFLLPVDDYITQDERENITGWWTVKEGLSDSGTPTYGYPNNDTGITCIFYNKKLIAQAGLDFESNRPETVDELMDVCATLKASGTTPILMSAKDGYFEAYMVPYWFGQVSGGTEKFMELLSGETTFADEPAFLEAINKQKELYDMGYMNEDILSVDSGIIDSRFLSGKGAMVIGGSWLISMLQGLGDDLGMIPFPSISADAAIKDTGIGGPGILVGVTNYCKNPDEAVKFVQFLESKEEMITFANYSPGVIPNRNDIDLAEVIENPLLLKQAEWERNGMIVWLDNVLPGEWAEEWFKLAPLFISGNISGEDYISRLDEKLAQAIQE